REGIRIMKRVFHSKGFIFYCGLILTLAGCATQGPKKASLDPEGERILDLMSYIILPVEEKILREMPPEDRKEFVDDFWARRDPDPSTPENEYRSTYYTRMATADQSFKAGKAGWKTDRGRIYILLGTPTNVIRKSMGDVPSSAGEQDQNPLERGTRIERATETWIYDQYQEQYGEPLSLIFIDFHSTGDYKLTSKASLTPYIHSSTWDPPDLAKMQIMADIHTDIITKSKTVIFDYGASAEIIQGTERLSAKVQISIPYGRLSYREDGEKYTCELSISAEIRDIQNNVITKKEEPFSQSFTEDNLKELLSNQNRIQKTWELDLPAGAEYIYISAIDLVGEKPLRKLLKIHRN
ncbi:GWxTD domain-containing protein, partial [Acidobacteriota bacterium]